MGKRKLAVLEAKYEEEKKKLVWLAKSWREETHEDSFYNLDEELRTTVQTYHRKNTHDNEQLRFKTPKAFQTPEKYMLSLKKGYSPSASKQHAAEAMIIGLRAN